MIKDNSGYRASPRRIETLVGNQSDASNASNSPKISKGSSNTPQISQKTKSPSAKDKSPKAQLTKSAEKIKPTKSVKTPKGSKRKASISRDEVPTAKKSRLSLQGKSKTPQKTGSGANILKLTKSTVKDRKTNNFYGKNAAKTPKGAKRKASISKNDFPTPKKTRVSSPIKSKTPQKKAQVNNLKLTKSTIKKNQSKNFYGKNSAKTPKGARVISKPLSRNDQMVKKQSTPKITKLSYSEIAKRPASKNAALQTKAVKAQKVISKVRKSSKPTSSLKEVSNKLNFKSKYISL